MRIYLATLLLAAALPCQGSFASFGAGCRRASRADVRTATPPSPSLAKLLEPLEPSASQLEAGAHPDADRVDGEHTPCSTAATTRRGPASPTRLAVADRHGLTVLVRCAPMDG